MCTRNAKRPNTSTSILHAFGAKFNVPCTRLGMYKYIVKYFCTPASSPAYISEYLSVHIQVSAAGGKHGRIHTQISGATGPAEGWHSRTLTYNRQVTKFWKQKQPSWSWIILERHACINKVCINLFIFLVVRIRPWNQLPSNTYLQHYTMYRVQIYIFVDQAIPFFWVNDDYMITNHPISSLFFYCNITYCVHEC